MQAQWASLLAQQCASMGTEQRQQLWLLAQSLQRDAQTLRNACAMQSAKVRTHRAGTEQGRVRASNAHSGKAGAQRTTTQSRPDEFPKNSSTPPSGAGAQQAGAVDFVSPNNAAVPQIFCQGAALPEAAPLLELDDQAEAAEAGRLAAHAQHEPHQAALTGTAAPAHDPSAAAEQVPASICPDQSNAGTPALPARKQPQAASEPPSAPSPSPAHPAGRPALAKRHMQGTWQKRKRRAVPAPSLVGAPALSLTPVKAATSAPESSTADVPAGAAATAHAPSPQPAYSSRASQQLQNEQFTEAAAQRVDVHAAGAMQLAAAPAGTTARANADPTSTHTSPCPGHQGAGTGQDNATLAVTGQTAVPDLPQRLPETMSPAQSPETSPQRPPAALAVPAEAPQRDAAHPEGKPPDSAAAPVPRQGATGSPQQSGVQVDTQLLRDSEAAAIFRVGGTPSRLPGAALGTCIPDTPSASEDERASQRAGRERWPALQARQAPQQRLFAPAGGASSEPPVQLCAVPVAAELQEGASLQGKHVASGADGVGQVCKTGPWQADAHGDAAQHESKENMQA